MFSPIEEVGFIGPRCIDVVTINYNAGLLLTRSVASAFDGGASKVIVVDNASVDGSTEHLELTVKSPGLLVIRNPKNIGFSAASNIALRNSSADTVLFLNPDAFLSEQALSRMFEALYSSPDIGMVGGLLRNLDGSEQAGGRRAFPTPGHAFLRAFRLSFLVKKISSATSDFELHTQPLPAQNMRVEAISGACMMVKRKAMTDVGNWDEQYFLHCEDLDLCMRFKQKGWSVLFVPKAPVYHAKGISSQSRPIFVEWHKHLGMVRFYRKFFREKYPYVLWYFVAVGIWMRFALVCSAIGLRSSVLGRPRFSAKSHSYAEMEDTAERMSA